MELYSYLQIPGGGIKRSLYSLWLWHLWTFFGFHAGQKHAMVKRRTFFSGKVPWGDLYNFKSRLPRNQEVLFSQGEWAERTRCQWGFQRERTLCKYPRDVARELYQGARLPCRLPHSIWMQFVLDSLPASLPLATCCSVLPVFQFARPGSFISLLAALTHKATARVVHRIKMSWFPIILTLNRLINSFP